MRKLLTFVGVIFILSSVSIAQNKKAEKEAAAKAQFEKALAVIEAKDFVIIVDTYEASDRTITTNTDATIFLSIEKEFAYLQGKILAGNDYTNKLNVSDYNQVADKKGNIKLVMQVKGAYVIAKIEISMKNDGNYADVIISPTKGASTRFSGEVVPRAESKYFKKSGGV